MLASAPAWVKALRFVPITGGMALDESAPRVTLGIASYNRDTYLAEAVRSCLGQDFPSLEVLVVLDGTTNPAVEAALEPFASDERLRIVRHEHNLGIAAAYNTFVSAGRGELIAMLGDDDICLPGRISCQVELFDRHPDTGVVHGDATVIDAAGRTTGAWTSAEMSPTALVQCLFRRHNYLVDPSRMVHRRVYELVGGYDGRFGLAQDFDFWLRAARHFRFRHCPGPPLIALRRHGANGSDESRRDAETADVTMALREALERYSLRELVPELDWAVLTPGEGERQALLVLADALERRVVPARELARELRERAHGMPRRAAPARRPADAPRRLMMTAYGWNDSGGGTTVPRLAAKELARRGWDVTVFHAAVADTGSGQRYELREWEQDGVRLIGVHNRPHALFDLGHPDRELDDPPIAAAFASALDRLAPDVVHFHNLHNLGASLIDHAAARGLPAYFTTHNYWLICPRAYLLTGEGAICAGPGDGGRCARCTGAANVEGHQLRLAEIRAKAARGLRCILAVSEAVRRSLLAAGYPPELVDVVRQAMPHDGEIWAELGRDRRPGQRGQELTVAFLGSAFPHKGPQLLVEAAQRCRSELRVRVLGEVPDRFAAQLRERDRRGVVELAGAFHPSEIVDLLRDVDAVVLPSLWWDCAPLAAAECLAARVPLVVPRLGGLPEAVRDDVDGLVFDGLDADDLAHQLDRLAAEPGLLARLQAAIRPPRAFSQYVDELEAYYSGERPGRVAGPVSADRLAIRWQGDHGLNTSLSIVNDRVLERLPAAVQRVERDGRALDPPLSHPPDVEVRHQWPPDLAPAPAGRLAVIQPWEFGAVPRAWLPALSSHVDELWVPSEYVRAMYLDAGVAADRVFTIPNGVDPDVFTPDGEAWPGLPEGVRFLFVGGFIWRKGADILLGTFTRAFAGRDDVTLVVKDFGADTHYRAGDRAALRERASSGELPRIVVLDDELSTSEMAALYRASDVLVHPYRGEGFAMPVLEAMACGLPVITTGGGPTDEFCPPSAGWRIRSVRSTFAAEQIDALQTAGRPWVLEPDADHLVELLRTAAADASERGRRGEAARAAAQRLSWDAAAAAYERRLLALAARPLRRAGGHADPLTLSGDVDLRILAAPAWRGEDRLADLLAEWAAATGPTTDACLHLLADPAIDGTPAELEARVLDAAERAGVNVDAAADIDVVMEPSRPDRDARLLAAVSAYVPLHAACAGHERLAHAAGTPVVELGALADLVTAKRHGLERKAA